MTPTLTAYLLWLPCLVGVCGLHRFYAGRPLTGLLWLATLGLLGIGQLMDLALIPGMVARPRRRAARRYRDEVDEYEEEDEVRCPRCGSARVTANKRGYGAAKAVGGLLLLGGVGLLGGFHGGQRVVVTCLKCAKQWRAG